MWNRIIRLTLVTVAFASFYSCKQEVLPKPSSQLRLDYPIAEYASFSNHCPFEFNINADAIIKENKECGFTIQYPKMKATIYLTYKTVNNDIDKLLRDAQKLTFEHVIKADDIKEQPFLNDDKKVYGMFYEVSGNAATNAQFYVTDSTKHFVTGSVYFYAKPNFDSIMPATSYVKNDMQRLMETIKWK
jgi:gliding motility-associated lipoprotein GldD